MKLCEICNDPCEDQDLDLCESCIVTLTLMINRLNEMEPVN